MEIQTFLAQVASTIEGGAFVSAKDAKAKGCMSTGEDAAWAIIDGQTSFTEAHVTLADAALAYFRGYEGDNKFLKGLRTVAAFDDVGMQQAERVAWVIPAYQRSMQEAAPDGFGADSEFVGEIGEEALFRGSVASAREVNVRGYPRQIVTLIDKANNVFVYWRSANFLPLKGGEQVRVFGKIKAHNVYNGVKQNVLTRAKIAVVPSV